jgi:hypothetical protein
MEQVIDPQDWRQRRTAGAAKATEMSLPWQTPQIFSAEPLLLLLLLCSLAVWCAAAVRRVYTVLAAASEDGPPQAGRWAPTPAQAAMPLSPCGSRS